MSACVCSALLALVLAKPDFLQGTHLPLSRGASQAAFCRLGAIAPITRFIKGLMALRWRLDERLALALPRGCRESYLGPQVIGRSIPWARASEPEARSTLLRPLEPGIFRSPEKSRNGMAAVRGDASDEVLMVRYQRGDREAFALLVKRYNKQVYNFVLRQLRAPALCEDVTQEVFMRLVQNAAEFKHEARFSTWLYAIARNLCIDQLRRLAAPPPPFARPTAAARRRRSHARRLGRRAAPLGQRRTVGRVVGGAGVDLEGGRSAARRAA